MKMRFRSVRNEKKNKERLVSVLSGADVLRERFQRSKMHRPTKLRGAWESRQVLSELTKKICCYSLENLVKQIV